MSERENEIDQLLKRVATLRFTYICSVIHMHTYTRMHAHTH